MTPRALPLILAAGLAVLGMAPVAAAQTPLPTPTPTPTPTPAPPPAKGTVKLEAEHVLRDRGKPVELTGDAWHVRGTVRPYVEGQRLRIRFTRDGRRVRTKRVTLQPGPAGTGTFRVKFSSPRPGRIAAVAIHEATPQLAAMRSRALRVRVVSPAISPGAGGAAVRLLQRGLKRLRYAVPRSGRYDAATQRAVMAWRKMTGAPRSYVASGAVVRGVLRGRGRFRVRHPRDGRHVEADLSRQVLALIDGKKVRRIYHTSSGAPATPTILGRYRVYLKTIGTNSLGMVDSSYFIRGYAIHGYVSVPAFNASHGCLRVPIPDARSIYNWLRTGDVVWVYP